VKQHLGLDRDTMKYIVITEDGELVTGVSEA
jgi:hypothetical protein